MLSEQYGGSDGSGVFIDLTVTRLSDITGPDTTAIAVYRITWNLIAANTVSAAYVWGGYGGPDALLNRPPTDNEVFATPIFQQGGMVSAMSADYIYF
jgi:hypothetical protein